MTGSTTADVVRRYIDALNHGDRDEIVSLVTEDFHNEHASSRGTTVRGRQAYYERLEQFLATFAGLHYEVEDLIVDGHRAAVPYRMSFTWLGAGPPGRPVSVRGIFRFRVADGRIAHRVDYWDSADVDRQIGR